MQLRNSILKVLAYFDVFDYPVTCGEILFFLDQDIPESQLRTALHALAREGCLFKLDRFYSLRDEPRLAERRILGNEHAGELLPIANKISRFLFKFPFVRGIGISGSLSKNFADEQADIDYFIITDTNRLWIARSFMHFFKKLSYLAGRQHWYCMNYYVDEKALEIEEKNIYTAIELITLMPVCGNGGLTKFFDANNWAAGYLPHYMGRSRTAEGSWHSSFFKRFFERLLNNRMGDWLDDFLMRLTSSRWQKKEIKGALNIKGEKMSLKTGKHFSRPNPEMLQKKILSAYSHRLKEAGIGPIDPSSAS